MKRPDITFVIGSMRIGGAERATLHLMNGLAAKGLTIELVLLHETGDFLSKINSGIRIIDLNRRKASQGILAFRKYLELSNPSKLFIVQNHIQIMVLLAVKMCSWKGKIILNEQSTYLQNLKGFKGKVQMVLSKFLFPRADMITVVSEGVGKELAILFPKLKSRIHVINNPVITNEFNQIKNQPVEHPFFESGKKVIVTAGRLTRSKNFDLLIHAFKIVIQHIPAKLIILGDGKQMSHLIKLKERLGLGDEISLQGFVSDPCRYFSKADLFVLSSDYEGLPGVIIEALGCGCKVVSTDCENGPREILSDEKYGWLSPVGNIQALSEKIQIALKANVDSSMLIRRANDFHEDKIVNDYLIFLNTLK